MVAEQEERYDIAFAGECLAGHDSSDVRRALGLLFKADDATLDRLFSGTRQSVKRHCDKATALKYQKSLANAGAKAIVTRASVATQVASVSATDTAPSTTTGSKPSTTPRTASSQAPATPTISAGPASNISHGAGPDGNEEFALLPGGSDILRPDERTQAHDAAVDLSHLSLAESGDRLSDAGNNEVAPIVAPDFDVAETGARMAEPGDDSSIAAPDTSALDLAPVGNDLSDPGETSPTPAVNTDHLDLADAGSDLLNADERKASDASAPDTSHLELDAPDNPFKT